jgi:4a-hydroxytetrahydrobiopterin dehydratase
VTHVGWIEDAEGLHRDFAFRDFAAAWEFMSEVARRAEQVDHHPDWCNRWNKVSITLISHDVGCVTERDRRLAAMIDEIAMESPTPGS